MVSVFSLLLIRTPFQADARPPAGAACAPRSPRACAGSGSSRLIRFLAFLAGGHQLCLRRRVLDDHCARQRTGAGEAAIGTIFSIASLGGLLGAVLARRAQGAFTLGQIVLGATWIEALLFPLYAFAPDVFVLGVITGVLFFVTPIFNVAVITYRLSLVPDALQGRVNSAARMIVFLFQPLGSTVGGFVLEHFGVPWAIGVCTLTLLGLALLTTIHRELRLVGRSLVAGEA